MSDGSGDEDDATTLSNKSLPLVEQCIVCKDNNSSPVTN